MAVSAASHLPSAHSPRIPASSYASLATFKQAARTVSATTEEASARCDITDPGRAHEMPETTSGHLEWRGRAKPVAERRNAHAELRSFDQCGMKTAAAAVRLQHSSGAQTLPRWGLSF